MIACYTDRTSVRPGEPFRLHASCDGGPCSLEIARVGVARETVWRSSGLDVAPHPTPDQADRLGCGWPVAIEILVGAEWRTGYYDLVLTSDAGEVAHHFVCVKADPSRVQPMVLVLATNTLHAYNYWGGRSAYCDVEALMSRRAALPDAMAGALGVLSTQRPLPPLLLAAPDDMPRLVNLEKRGFGQRPWAGADPAWSRAHRQSPYDGSAGYLNKWEHAFVRWAEAEGISFDYLTDYDLDSDPAALAPYKVVVLVGHSEYWSGPQRDRLERFVDGGGRLAILSGNTAFWKVRWEDDGRTLVCHKGKGETAEDVPAAEATHLWSHPMFARPEAEITGLSFIFGGYHRLGLCAARGQGGYTVYRPDHWALDGADLYWGDVFGDDVPLVGYENDGCALSFGEDGLPAPRPNLGTPANLEIIAMAPATFAEAPGPYRPLIPPEQLDVVARIAFGDDSPSAQQRVLRGHAVMAAFRRGEGEVFNAGTTEWAHGLAARNPFVERITRNVLTRFSGGRGSEPQRPKFAIVQQLNSDQEWTRGGFPLWGRRVAPTRKVCVVKFRVLIVEDDPFIAMDLEGVLSDAGCEVCGVAASEAEALRMGEETRPPFAVVDVRLSPGDGRVVARELSRQYDTAVLMATAHSRELDNLAATGAVACLPKPYSADDVPAALQAILELREGRPVSRLPNHMFQLNPRG